MNASKEGTVELHCSLNTYKGYSPCKNRNIHIEWSWEDNTPLKGHRFISENPSECFSKLLIHLKPTDHQRKWKCRLFQNSTLKAAISKTTTIQGTKLYFTQSKYSSLTRCIESLWCFSRRWCRRSVCCRW